MGAWYGRWRTGDGRRLNRRLGPVRSTGEADGLTRREAERAFRHLQDEEERHPTRAAVRHTVNDAADALRQKLALVGSSRSHLRNTETMQRLHIGPALGDQTLQKVTRQEVEQLGERLLARGLSPKTVRDVIVFLHAVFEHAIDLEWTRENPVRRAAPPKRRRARRSRLLRRYKPWILKPGRTTVGIALDCCGFLTYTDDRIRHGSDRVRHP